MLHLSVFLILLTKLLLVACSQVNHKIVSLDQGDVRGDKYWNGDYYEFYGIPYASVPSGRDRFKAPLQPKPWDGIFEANNKNIHCPQVFVSDAEEGEEIIGQEECLTMNILVPLVASDDNLLPVVVYIHSGAFSAGHGNMASFKYLARHDVIVASFNYRLGALGFLCLGTEDAPGNAALKDQVAALRWIHKNIERFGGNPKKVTLAGFSVGAAMAEILSLSDSTINLFDKIILESGSALAPWAIDKDPIQTAFNHAKENGYNKTKNTKDLAEFYLTKDAHTLSSRSLHFFLENSTFGFAPCIEKSFENIESVLTEHPKTLLEKGSNDVAVITGFSNREGLSRLAVFDEWKKRMANDLSDFLPADLEFPDDTSRNVIVNKIKEMYFNDAQEFLDINGYVDYISDVMFKYSILKSLKLRANYTKHLYLYDFCYVGNLNKHNYPKGIQGASHRDQTAYILDFFVWTNKPDDLAVRDRMTYMWTDFINYGNPTSFESLLIDVKWKEYSHKSPYYMKINKTMDTMMSDSNESFEFWDQIYEKYYWR